ncbi:hypothetical protein K7432_018101 [Basidiobolus ranarum]|uniref:Uncharacterized protein n=1 Tax=Basidiobolus ranarum TaxID=34480 RepID=A0ABR2WCK4_9FUNG
MLVLLTVYALIVRYASFDLFLLVLFASHCTILFLMKNSTKVNMQMAKRTVRQRVNWAKQWAGGIFRKNGPPPNSVQPRPSNIVLYPGKQSSNTSPTESPNTSQPDSTRSQKRFFLRAKNNTSPDLGSNNLASENLPSPPATKQKRRFFSKSKGNNPNLLPPIETSDIEPDGSKLL